MNITSQFGNYRVHAGAVDYAKLQFSTPQATTTDASVSNAPTSIAPVDASPTVAKPAFDSEALAKSILSFVQQRLSKEAEQGASKEQLAALLAQAQEGVTTGFKQAAGELKNSGALTDTISSGISSALQKVDSGFDDLAKQFGLTTASTTSSTPANTNTATATVTTTSNSPSPSTISNSSTTSSSGTPVATQTTTTPAPQTNTLSQLASAYNVKFSSKQSIDLLVKTADGDTVHIQLGVKDKLSFSAGNQTNPNGQQAFSASEKSSARLNISVDGNLDAGELQALGDLFNKVGDLANSFFSGDVNGALQQATALNFASPELSSLSLDLRSSVSVKAKVATYAAVQALGSAPSSAENTTTGTSPTTSTPTALRLTDLADALTSLLPKASLADNPASLLKQLLAAQIGAANQQNNPLLDFANRLLDVLGADTSSQATASTPGTTATSDTTTASAIPTTTAPTKTTA